MSDASRPTAAPQAIVVVERVYRAPVEDLWALWTTKAGFESWWGPEGFRVLFRQGKRLSRNVGGVAYHPRDHLFQAYGNTAGAGTDIYNYWVFWELSFGRFDAWEIGYPCETKDSVDELLGLRAGNQHILRDQKITTVENLVKTGRVLPASSPKILLTQTFWGSPFGRHPSTTLRDCVHA